MSNKPAQSEVGQYLNRLMLETGLTPLQTISLAMVESVSQIGNHKFYPKPEKPETTSSNDKVKK